MDYSNYHDIHGLSCLHLCGREWLNGCFFMAASQRTWFTSILQQRDTPYLQEVPRVKCKKTTEAPGFSVR